MNYDFENPFSNYGKIVRGERFIGRRDSLRVIENRVIRPREPGNLAIIGDYRIGKSSLVYKGVIERKDELITRKLLPIRINLPNYDKAPTLFRSLVTQCFDEMEELGWLTETIKHAAINVLQDELSWGEGYERIQRFFIKTHQAGYSILFILDEFDHARYLFKGDIQGFQGLRELSYNPECGVILITISRRTLRSIELQTKSISTFDLIFLKHYLTMFNDSDIQEYFARMSSVGITITPIMKERIDFYCGGHPYLMEMLGYEIVEMFRDKRELDIDQVAHSIEHLFLDQYDHMIDILKEDDRLSKILQILFGPVVDAKQVDADEFLKYGLIKPTERGNYIAFSGHFQLYLRLIERQVSLWPLWSETEIKMRRVITNKMLDQYGEQWIDKLEKTRPNLKPIFEECRVAQQREEKLFGSRASRNLVDFTYPQDLFTIIFAEWNIFKSIFGKDKNYWSQHAQLLAKIGNPLAHNRNEALYDYEKKQAEGYCEEILLILHKDNNNSTKGSKKDGRILGTD